jgi:nitroreductase
VEDAHEKVFSQGGGAPSLWLAITVAIFAIPAWQVWSSFSSADISEFSDIIAPLLTSLFWIAAGAAALLFAGFFLAPLWIYYAIDGRGFFDSIGRSVWLVMGNFWTFLTLSLVFFGIGIGTIIVTFASIFCCLAWLVSPVLSVAASLLYGVTLMKVKMALEK